MIPEAQRKAATNRRNVGIVIAFYLYLFAGPAMAQIPIGGLETFTTDIWDFFIENIGLMVVGLTVLGALLGAMVGDTGRGVGKAIVGAAIGAFIAAVPAVAEYVLDLGG